MTIELSIELDDAYCLMVEELSEQQDVDKEILRNTLQTDAKDAALKKLITLYNNKNDISKADR